MIEALRIENLGVIAEAEIGLGPGLTVISGETGAGKTMMLTALKMVMGAKVSPALVRQGCEQARAELEFDLRGREQLTERVLEAGGYLDDEVVLLARSVPSEGRSRAYLGGRTVPLAVLEEILGTAVTVHGQADQARLRSSAHQRAALDEAGGAEHTRALAVYRQAWNEWETIAARLREVRENRARIAQEIAGLRAVIAQVEKVDPAPGEEDELREEARRATAAEEIRADVTYALGALMGFDSLAETAAAGNLQAMGAGAGVVGRIGAMEEIANAQTCLEKASASDDFLGELAQEVGQAAAVLEDIAARLAQFAEQIDADPQRLEWVHARRAELTALGRSLFTDADGALRQAEQARVRLGELTDPGAGEEELAEREALAREHLEKCGKQLHAARLATAEQVQAAVDRELAGLAMADAELLISVTPQELASHGADEVTFRLRAHRAGSALPVAQAASGGELSRIMLALELTLAERSDSPPATFIFDEVDAGVGGKAALEIGRRLAQLARRQQVIVVTHVAQVAAYADHQFVVEKTTNTEQAPITEVRQVREDERVAEIARMLSGHADQATALAHARELLESARGQIALM